MARATVTIRQLKNKDTGIDLAVTSVKEVKAMIGSTYEYEVMVVSNLACFKNAKHKESDNVQFTVHKKFNEFEDLHLKLNTKYTGTVFPQLPKKVIKVSAQVAKDRRPDLEQFLKFLAMTDKLSSCPLILEFLGVSSVKASNFRKPDIMEPAEKEPEKEGGESTEREPAKPDEDLFDEADDDDDDDDDLFSDQNTKIDIQDVEDTKIFDDQDYGGALNDDDDSELFVPDARSEVKDKGQGQTVSSAEDEEGTEDLLNIEDDLEDLVKLSTKPKQAKNTPNTAIEEDGEPANATEVPQSPTKVPQSPTKVPGNATKVAENAHISKPKPALSKKPNLPAKKPALNPGNDKDSKTLDGDNMNTKEETKAVKPKLGLPQKPKPPLHQKPSIGQKPALAKKPEIKPKPSDSNEKVKITVNAAKEVETAEADLNEDDILKYIQENDVNNNDDDLDLFS